MPATNAARQQYSNTSLSTWAMSELRRKAWYPDSLMRRSHTTAGLREVGRSRASTRQLAIADTGFRGPVANPFPTNLLSCDMIGADYVAPKFDLALEQCTRGLGRFLILLV